MTNQSPKTNQGSAIRFRASHDKSGSRRTHQGPQDGSGPHETDQGPAGRSRALQDESGPRRMKQGPAGRIKVPQDVPGSPQDESGSHKTNQDPAGRTGPSRTNRGHFIFVCNNTYWSKSRDLLFWGYPGNGPPHQVVPTQKSIIQLPQGRT